MFSTSSLQLRNRWCSGSLFVKNLQLTFPQRDSKVQVPKMGEVRDKYIGHWPLSCVRHCWHGSQALWVHIASNSYCSLRSSPKYSTTMCGDWHRHQQCHLPTVGAPSLAMARWQTVENGLPKKHLVQAPLGHIWKTTDLAQQWERPQ